MARTLVLQVGLLGLLAAASAGAQDEAPAAPQAPAVEWKTGPATAALGGRAEIDLPAEYRFAGEADTRKLLEWMGNPTSGTELGFVNPVGQDWFVVFEFSEIGYVKDDEKDKLDADAILKSIREGTAASNEERKKRGWATLEVVGWEVPPRYDPQTNNLEWAVRARSEGHDVVNYNTRILGRKGVMEAALVVDPEQLQATLPAFRGLIAGFRYGSGEKYSEWKKGDKVAAVGLAALVAGGAAAVALKSGFLQKFFKLIVVGAVALLAALKKLVGGLFGRKDGGAIRRG